MVAESFSLLTQLSLSSCVNQLLFYEQPFDHLSHIVPLVLGRMYGNCVALVFVFSTTILCSILNMPKEASSHPEKTAPRQAF